MIDTLQSYMDASPFVRDCGMRVVEADKDRQRLRIDMPLIERLERGTGSRQFHGGAIASLIDTAGTFALVMLSGKAIPTINFRTDFLRPAIDTTLSAEARVRRVGRAVGVVDIDVTDQEGILLAVGRGTFGTWWEPPMDEVTNLGDLAQRGEASATTALIDLSGNRERRFSFSDIDGAANAIALELGRSGQPRQAAIGILGKNSYEYLVCYLGVLKAGMVAVLLNYKLPDQALEFVISDAEVSLVFAEEGMANQLPASVTRIPISREDRTPPTSIDIEKGRPDDFGGEDAALILYTSGSTGRPTGVVLSHQSQLAALQPWHASGALDGRSTIVAAACGER